MTSWQMAIYIVHVCVLIALHNENNTVVDYSVNYRICFI